MKAENYADLLDSLETWMSWEDQEMYDFGGMMGIFGACLTNLSRFGVEGELDEVANYLEPGQLNMLLRLADYARGNPAEDEG